MSDYDFSLLPDQPKPQYEFSILPDQPKSEITPDWMGEAPPKPEPGMWAGEMPPAGWHDDIIVPPAPAQPLFTSVPRPPERLYRENAPQLLQDIRNATSPEPTVGPIREHPLRPDIRQPLWTLFKEQALPNEPTGVVENMEAGLRQASAHVAAKVISLIGSPMDDSGGPTREEQYNSVYKAIYKTILPDNLAPPQDFTDSLARGVGEAAPGLVETMLLSCATGGALNPLFEGMAAKFPTLAAKLFPIARDALTFGTQGALEPEQPGRQALIGTGVGATLAALSPYSRLARMIWGAGIGAGQAYLTNPNATAEDYARSATLTGAFVGLAASHGLSVEETIGGTLLDWAKTKGYTAEEIGTAVQTLGIRPVLNEFAEDMTAPQTENLSGAVAETEPGEQIGTIEPIAGTQEPIVGERQGEYSKLSETPEFENWFGDSKVVFKKGQSNYFQNPNGIAGTPRMVYHGADPGNDLFHPDEQGAIVFSSTPEGALAYAGEGAEIVPAYLKIENPLEISSGGSRFLNAAIDEAKAKGNDGVIIDHVNGTYYTYAVFSPDQVKSPFNRDIFKESDSGLFNDTDRPHAKYTTVALIFQQIKKRAVEILGLPVRSHTDLAVLAQGWRNPNYEELRYVYVKDGIIVDHEGVTCRLPAQSRAFLGDEVAGIQHLKERIAALGADSLYLVHNHPSGNVETSVEDRNLTAFVAKEVPEMKGHIVINSGKYAFIDPNGVPKTHDLPGLPEKWIDPILTPSVPHRILGESLQDPGKIAAWSKKLTAERNKPLIVYLNPRFEVRGLQEINPGGTLDWKQLADAMPKKLVDFGSTRAVLILPERSHGYMLEIGETFVRRGVFYDVVSVDADGPRSVKGMGTHVDEEKRFGGRPLSDFPAQSIK